MEEILKKLNYQREFLTEDDILNLMSLSAHFFVNYPVNEARQRLRELYQSWIYQSYECADSEKIKDMLLFGGGALKLKSRVWSGFLTLITDKINVLRSGIYLFE